MSGLPPGFPEHGNLADEISEIKRRLRALESSAHGAFSGDGTNAFLRGGDLRLTDGRIQIFDASGDLLVEFDVTGAEIFQADGSVLVQLDGTGIRLNDGSGTKLIDLTTSGLQAYEADGSTLVVLDGSKLRFNRADGTRQLEITPGGGLKIYDTNGTTEKVVLDSGGLTIDGGQARALDVSTDSSGAVTGVALTTTETELASTTLTPPSWATSAIVIGLANVQGTDEGNGPLGLEAGCRIDDVDLGARQADSNGLRVSVMHPAFSLVDPIGASVKVSCYGERVGGSGDLSNVGAWVWATAIWLR